MIRNLLPALLLIFPLAAQAEPVDLSCYWDKPVGKTQGAAGAVGKLFATPADPLYLRVDAAANTVANNDPDHQQAGLLPTLRLSASGNSITITASSPALRELQGMTTLLEISVSRYSLDSEMIFVMPESFGSPPVSQWTRAGRCVIRKF